MIQQVTFKDFVIETRKWQKWAKQEIEDMKSHMAQLQSAFGHNENSMQELHDEVTNRIADMSATLQEVNDMLSELLDNMPGGEDEEEEAEFVDESEYEDNEPDVDEQQEQEDFAHDGELDNYTPFNYEGE